jgi:hypothetical protein
MHSTDPRWKPNNHEDKLLNVVEKLLVDLAQTHPSFSRQDVADVIAHVVLPGRKVQR